ncbi:MAG: DUF4905 domain-containing protein [Ignavibacteriales bacterium]|nr:DUF4905 domain-containing protein [Ignavibacteriales bacterium]
MKLFSLFQSHQRTPEWTYTAHGAIWRLMFSATGKIVGECRHHDQKLASFFCVDEQTGMPYWEDVKLAEPWWVGIEAVHNDVVILHEFSKPDLPEHKRIRVVDIATGILRWRNDELTFWFAHRDTLYAYRDMFEKRVGYALALQTGAIQQSYEDTLEELGSLRKLALLEEQDAGEFLFPEIVQDGSLSPSHQALLTKEIKGKSIIGNIEFIQEQEYLLMNYYTPASRSTPDAPLLENHFSVFETERGNEVFSDVLSRDSKSPVPDAFFIKRPFSYFVKDQKILTALRLWKL